MFQIAARLQQSEVENTRQNIFPRSDRKSLVDAGVILMSPTGRTATFPNIPVKIGNFDGEVNSPYSKILKPTVVQA